MRKCVILAAGFGVLFFQAVSGQIPTNPQEAEPRSPNDTVPQWVRRNEQKRREMDRLNGRNENGMIAGRTNPRIPRPPRTKADGKPYTEEELARIEALKKPSPADVAQYSEFLKQPRTGIFRLFPFLPCTEKYLIRTDGECANFIPDSFSYSFRLKGYSDQHFFDLKSKDGNLVTGGILSLGVLTALGDVALETVSLNGDGMKFLADMKPETVQKDAEKQMGDFIKGVETGGYKYQTKIKIDENMTYGMRVVAYRIPDSVTLQINDPKNVYAGNFLSINRLDERDDIIIAFRVVRKEEDGNVTILWKELKREDAPKLVFPKDVKTVTVSPS